MAIFKCRHCGAKVKRDLRDRFAKTFLTKRGYRSWCEKTGKDTFLIRVR
jgi:hypothetical protein